MSGKPLRLTGERGVKEIAGALQGLVFTKTAYWRFRRIAVDREVRDSLVRALLRMDAVDNLEADLMGDLRKDLEGTIYGNRGDAPLLRAGESEGKG